VSESAIPDDLREEPCDENIDPEAAKQRERVVSTGEPFSAALDQRNNWLPLLA
jgi:hypothetical protein